MTFWCGLGSRSADPCLCLWQIRILDPDLAIYVIELQDANKKQNFFFLIFCLLLLFLKLHLHNFSKIKVKKSHKIVGIKVFLLFSMMIEGSGSISLTNGSGSGRPKTGGSGGSGSATLLISVQKHNRTAFHFVHVHGGLQHVLVLASHRLCLLLRHLHAGLAIKNPPKKTQKNHLKNPLKMFFLDFFKFLIFLFFMKIIQTFLFETNFVWTHKT